MHPLRIGALYGLIAAVLTVGGFELNHTAFGTKGNGIIAFLFGFLLPIVALYLAGHYAGRHERFNLSTAVTGGLRATLHGTGAGAVAGLVFLILTQLAQKLPLPVTLDQLQSLGALGTLLGAGLFVLSFIGWLVGGTLLGTIGGAIGDGQAHRELKKNPTLAATAK